MDILTVNDRLGSHPNSYYAATANIDQHYPVAEGDITADVCVVGGGYSGLSAALFLARRGYDVVLLEASRVGFGASGRNGGQVSVGQRKDQRVLESQFGQSRAKTLWDISVDSVSTVRQLVAESDINCEITPGIVTANHRKRYSKDTRAYVDHLQNHYGYHRISYLNQAQIRSEVASDDYYSGALDVGSFHLHPLKYVLALAKLAKEAGVKIYENSRMTALHKPQPGQRQERVTVTTSSAKITARYCVLGLNGYHNNVDKNIEQKVMPINNYIAVTKPLADGVAESLIEHNYAVADSRFVVNYFRLTQDKRLLFGGGESYGYQFPQDLVAKVRRPMLTVFPQLANTPIDFAWGGTLGITMSRLPHFCKLSHNVLSVSGYSGHGVAMATQAGKIAASAIAGQAESFDVMAEIPNLSFPGGAKLRYPALVMGMLWYSLLDKF